MRNHERIAMAAIVSGLRKSGAIDNAAVAAIAKELTEAARQMEHYGSHEHAQMVALADDVAHGRVTSQLVVK